MARSSKKNKAQETWERIEALGGHGVWESDMVVVSFAGSGVKDEDMAVLADCPVQILDVSDTALTDKCLVHLESLESLQTLTVAKSKITKAAIEGYRKRHPTVEVTAGKPKGKINPFTGEPL